MIGKTISHYRILSMLGEGGMGVVYKAEDTKLKRTVALKFLSPKVLGTDAEKTRFVHEAQAAAALSHPNICTVYEIDESDGQTFIAMECVGGQSLRDKIGSGPLKLDDVIDVAIQVAEGLREAHERGIVHRDVKSGNIMVTPKCQAKIMDFGLAKLPGATKLTKTGAAVGTIAYMSPEQARGESVDHRTDIWSFGAVMYEMVTGRLPFRGDYSEAVVYSILNEVPEAVTSLRSGVPLELERIVGKALEKEPGRRYQRMEDLLVDLRNLRDGRVPGVAGRERFVREVATEEVPKKGAGLSRVSLKGALGRKVLIPVLVLGVVAAAVVFGVRVQVGRQPSAVAAENSLAILYFDNLADPEDSGRLGEIATSLLITDLSESQYVKVLSSQRLYDILKLMGREGEKRIDRQVATQVAERAGARWMLLGTILQVEPQLEMSSQLVDVSSGQVRASQRVAGEPGERIFSLVDKLTAEVKRDLSLPEAAQKEPDPRVADVTTNSPEAYRYYVEGMEYFNKTYDLEAQESFRKAVEFDSTFAMAYYRLWMNVPAGDESRQLMAKMEQHSEKASRKERAYIQWARLIESRRFPEALRQLKKIAEEYRDDKEAFFLLGAFLEDDAKTIEEAIQCYTKAVEIDSLYRLAYHGLAYAYHSSGDFDRSIWAINKYISSAPGEPEPYGVRGDLYAWSGQLTKAIESYQRAMELKPDWYGTYWRLGHMYLFLRQYEEAEKCYRKLTASTPYVRSVGRVYLGVIPAYQGKFQEALHILDAGLAGDKMEKIDKPTELNKRFLKAKIYLERSETALALEEARICMEREKEIYATRPLYSLRFYGEVLVKAGRLQEAERVAREYAKGLEQHDPTAMPSHSALKGQIELARGRADEAVRLLEKARDGYSAPDFEWRIDLARAYLAAGRLDAAVKELEAAMQRYDESMVESPIEAVKAHYLLGLAYERSGWKDRAIEQYEEFLDIWKDADPGIKEMADARARLARLKGAS